MHNWIIVVAAVVSSAIPALGASPTDLALYGKDPGQARAFACYTRHYSAAHLKAHPQQNVTDMTVLVDRATDDGTPSYNLSIGVNFRTLKNQFEVSGGCSGDIDGQHLLSCGVDCDGGEIDVRLKNASSILVDIPNGARTWDPAVGPDLDDTELPEAARFGSDDKTFLLSRAPLKNCEDLVWDPADRKLLTDAAR